MIEYEEYSRELFEAIARFRHKRMKLQSTGDLCMSEMTVFGAMMKLSEGRPQGEPVPMSELIGEVHISKPALSQIINKLENKGLVERVPSRENRRSTYLSFTDLGREIYNREHDKMVTTLNTVVAKMGAEDTKTLITLLTRLHSIEAEVYENMQKGEGEECQDCLNT